MLLLSMQLFQCSDYQRKSTFTKGFKTSLCKSCIRVDLKTPDDLSGSLDLYLYILNKIIQFIKLIAVSHIYRSTFLIISDILRC